MIVYRIAHKSGEGPFVRGPSMYNAMVDASWHRRGGNRWVGHGSYPDPDNERLTFGADRVCACSSARQLVDWFPKPIREALRKRGEFSFEVIELPDEQVSVGNRQVTIPKGYTPLNTRPI